jgi:DNA-binding CsgD family transcriptional regulator
MIQASFPSIESLPEARRGPVLASLAAVYSGVGELADFPLLVAAPLRSITGAQVAGYGELDERTGLRRALIDPVVPEFAARRDAYARHRESHAFWQMDPAYFRDGPRRLQDAFGPEAFRALPIFREALAPVGVTDLMQTAWAVPGGRVGFGVFRLGGQFSEEDRAAFAALQPHLVNARELAWHRTLHGLDPQGRIALLHPQLSARQREVLTWLAQGKDNGTIATLLGIRVETVKDHLKDIYAALGVESRLEAALSVFDVDQLHVPHPRALLPGTASAGSRPVRRRRR